jgi:hypothetical protein
MEGSYDQLTVHFTKCAYFYSSSCKISANTENKVEREWNLPTCYSNSGDNYHPTNSIPLLYHKARVQYTISHSYLCTEAEMLV